MPTSNQPRSALTIAASCLLSLAATLSLRGAEPTVAVRWWDQTASGPILNVPDWVSFDLNAIVVDALSHNPRIAAVTHEAAIALERVVQEDAVFDPALLLESKYGSTSDPVGNSLATGGPPRLQQDSWDNRAGIVKTNRDGTRIDLSQNAGLLNSNSLFFTPNNQGNTRLNLSVTRPLQAGAGRTYNERLILQARIDSKVTLQEMRDEVQQRLAMTMTVYWRLYQSRCQLIQHRGLLERGLEIEKVVQARRGFDSGELEISKIETRITRRRDQLLDRERELKNLQTELATLVGSPALRPGNPLEMIPLSAPSCVPIDINVHDAVVNAMTHRSEIRSAALELESASLAISVTRNELLPQLDAVVGGYLAALNGANDVSRSFGDQFSSRPGFNGGLMYELPYARRASRSRHRAAHQQYLEMSERYREAVSKTQAEVETAARNLQTAMQRLETKRQIWQAAVKQEALVRCRWEQLGSDGRHAALVLEDLLDQQENRTAAENDLVESEVRYLLALIELQTAMGTLLTAEGIEPTPIGGQSVEWTHSKTTEPIQSSSLVPSSRTESMIEEESRK
ncbi:MAG: TolC family protein [Planctomycetaceae bacterium]